jgi:hypothetical protein
MTVSALASISVELPEPFDLGQFRDQWVSAIYACRAAQ